eukprot:CAMPEP_0169217060 /NCGR_PEP_ID=MMETSP1016-20121227/18707_1 /TAXON_ID=342587 /ORGANISM="Karlodinium micrum, Strain CCMP2283" /LENGTH=450 /DNA_ID=CAMNT_0009294963 /DNA_START=93 /DNA_END=1448 /DNA_ORIENTATION=+
MDKTAPPEPENGHVATASIPHRVEILSGMCIVAVVCLLLSPVLASLLLACMPVAAYLISVLSASRDENAIERESIDKSDVARARDVIDEAETKKNRAVEDSPNDRDRLAALGGSENGAHLSSLDSDADSTSNKRAELQKAAEIAARACEERRVEADNATALVEKLRQRARDLEAEIEATFQQGEIDQARREEENKKLRGEASRFRAKITAQDEQLRHARGAVKSWGGDVPAEETKEGELCFVESVSQTLKESLHERNQELNVLHARLKLEATEKQSVTQAIEDAKELLSKCQTSKDCDDKDALDTSGTSPKAKSKSNNKSAKAKKKKDGSKEIEDLELERASIVAATEFAQKKARDMAKAAETKFAEAKKHAEGQEKESKQCESKLEQLAKEKVRIAGDQAKITAGLKQQSERIPQLEGLIKEAERTKIRFKLDAKKLKEKIKKEKGTSK